MSASSPRNIKEEPDLLFLAGSHRHSSYYFSSSNKKFKCPLRDVPYWKPFRLQPGAYLRPIEGLSRRQGRSQRGRAAGGRRSCHKRQAMAVRIGTLIASFPQYTRGFAPGYYVESVWFRVDQRWYWLFNRRKGFWTIICVLVKGVR